ncbi:hypothetical protein BH20ACT23_BH20ACT23_25200 [soil metagenome]
MWRMLNALLSIHEDEKGDVPGWVLIVLMSAGLVIAIWGIAEGRLVDIFSNALDTVCGGIGC